MGRSLFSNVLHCITEVFACVFFILRYYYLLQALQPDHHGTELDFITLTVTQAVHDAMVGCGATLLELFFFSGAARY